MGLSLDQMNKVNDWFEKVFHLEGKDYYRADEVYGDRDPNYNYYMGVEKQNTGSKLYSSEGNAANGFTLNPDGSVDLNSLGSYGLDGLVDQVAAYFKASDPRINYAWSAQEAAKNRDWQTAMSSTAYQRAVNDMKSAGLNPILAYTQGGASTTGGATASASPTNSGASLGSLLSGVTGLVKTLMSEDRLSDRDATRAANEALRYQDSHSATAAKNKYYDEKAEFYNFHTFRARQDYFSR